MDDQRQSRALELCDMAERLFNEGPLNWQTGFVPIEVGDLRIKRVRIQAQRPGRLPNAVHIAWRKRNVLTIKYSRSGDRQVLLYEPGEWEGELKFLLTPGQGRAQ